MNAAVLLIYGICGMITGWKIPEISTEIISRKGKEIENLNKILYSDAARYIICIVNAGAWVLSMLKSQSPLTALLISVQITICILVAFIDINIRIIPNECTILILVTGILFQVFSFGLKALIPSIITMFAMMGLFILVAGFVGFGKVGAGDVKLAGAMGLALGYPLIITSMAIMSAVLIVFIGTGIASKKIALSTMLPLAPFITAGYAGVLIAYLF